MPRNTSFRVARLLGALLLSLGLRLCNSQSTTTLFLLSNKKLYVIIPVTKPASTHVRARRIRQGDTEYLDIINIFLPADFVHDKLVQTQDIVRYAGLSFPDKILVTMTVLPWWQSGQVNWVPIQLDSIAWQTVADDCYTHLFNYAAVRYGSARPGSEHRRMDVYPIIKCGNQYFTPLQQVLTEYFIVRDRPTWYPTQADNATLNSLA